MLFFIIYKKEIVNFILLLLWASFLYTTLCLNNMKHFNFYYLFWETVGMNQELLVQKVFSFTPPLASKPNRRSDHMFWVSKNKISRGNNSNINFLVFALWKNPHDYFHFHFICVYSKVRWSQHEIHSSNKMVSYF